MVPIMSIGAEKKWTLPTCCARPNLPCQVSYVNSVLSSDTSAFFCLLLFPARTCPYSTGGLRWQLAGGAGNVAPAARRRRRGTTGVPSFRRQPEMKPPTNQTAKPRDADRRGEVDGGEPPMARGVRPAPSSLPPRRPGNPHEHSSIRE